MSAVLCDYYGNTGSNLSGGYCQNGADWDLGRRRRIVGLPYEARWACDEHANRIVPFRWRQSERGRILPSGAPW